MDLFPWYQQHVKPEGKPSGYWPKGWDLSLSLVPAGNVKGHEITTRLRLPGKDIPWPALKRVHHNGPLQP